MFVEVKDQNLSSWELWAKRQRMRLVKKLEAHNPNIDVTDENRELFFSGKMPPMMDSVIMIAALCGFALDLRPLEKKEKPPIGGKPKRGASWFLSTVCNRCALGRLREDKIYCEAQGGFLEEQAIPRQKDFCQDYALKQDFSK